MVSEMGADGILQGTLPTGAYEVFIAADGYGQTHRVLKADRGEQIWLEVVLLQPRVTVGEEELELTEKIFFELDSSTIKPESHSLLDEVSAVLRVRPEIRLIEVQGHTDDQGSEAYNEKLSRKRAEAVRQYLIDRGGIEPIRLRAEGYGERYPLVNDTSEAARETNRRVTFVLLNVEQRTP